MTAITPCLWFDGNGLEAAEYYVSVIPDSRITDVSHYAADQPGQQGAVLTVAFELAGRPFTALNGGPAFKFTEAISMQVSAANQEEVDRYTEQLTADLAAVQAMMGMTKIDIQALRDAADATGVRSPGLPA
jgi:predicted 3-demethylubiquinone-9 3-methyltransferase (glyoxalase superfamily)